MSVSATVRRARPLLGTLVEIGACDADGAAAQAAIEAAFARIAVLQERLSRFVAASDVGRFNGAAAGTCIDISADARAVLDLASGLRDASDGAFDVTLGSGTWDWRSDERGLHKRSAAVRIDLGGIAKGHAVDCAIETLAAAGLDAGWVNAGGDLRAFGALALPIDLRDETGGGVHRFAIIAEGAFATSRLHDASGETRHASVAAPRCAWADALTKVVVATVNPGHPLLARFGAQAWLHESQRREVA